MRRPRYLLALFFVVLGLFLLCLPVFAGNIVVYGDSQSDEWAQKKVVEAILKYKPSMIFRVGDIVDDGNDPAQWEKFRQIAAPLLKSAEYYPALGNHEKSSPLYFENFTNIQGRHWYSVKKDRIHFIVLDSNFPLHKKSEQYRWLEQDLKEARLKSDLIIVFFHHPLFSVGIHEEDEKKLKPLLMPLFKKYHVSAVFSGHDHSYQRFMVEGVPYVVTGGGGSHLRDKSRSSPYLKKFKKAYHFCVLSKKENYLEAEVFDVEGKRIDEFRIIQNLKSSNGFQ